MESENLKLKYNGDNASIASPSGKKITASKLEAGKTYLHTNLHFLRTILVVAGDTIFYTDEYGGGRCSCTHFAALCPYEATEEEIAFLTTKHRY